MSTTPRAHDPVTAAPAATDGATRPLEETARSARDRLRAEVDDICSGRHGLGPRGTVDAALGTLAEMQVVGANLDACHPPQFAYVAREVTRLADGRLRGQPDAIERGLAFGNDRTLRQLHGE